MTPETLSATLDRAITRPARQATRKPREEAAPSIRVQRTPRWLAAADLIHRGERRPAVALLDSAVMVCAGIAAGVPALSVAIMWALLAVALYVGGWYSERTCVETQGVLWAARPIGLPIGLMTLGTLAVAEWAGWSMREPLLFGATAFASLLVVRSITWLVLAMSRRRGLGLQRTLIVGDTKHSRLLSRKLIDFPEAGLLPVAMLPAGNGHGYTRFLPAFPSAEQLSSAISDGDITHVVLAPDGDEGILECVKSSEGLEVSFSLLPPLSELFIHPGLVAQVGGLPLMPLGGIANHHRTLPGKRIVDMFLTSLIVLVTSPLLAVTAAAIKIFDGGPVLYRQRRVGRDGRVFHMMKFRSMRVGAERLIVDLRDQNVTNGLLFKVNDDPRITRVGRLIRRFSVDELPQLWNVLRGDMSLVGPRPLAVEPEDFGPVDNTRHAVLPGITGYWQIAGGNGLTYEEMIKLDLAYIENWSLWLDLRLLARTIPALINRRGPF